MSTLRVTNIEAKGDPSSPSVDEKLKLTNSTGDIVLEVDGKNVGAGQTVFVGSGIVTATTVNANVSATTVSATTVSVAGSITATNLYGDASSLTGIDATALKSGGVVKVQANSSGSVTTGVATVTSQITVGNSFLKDEAVGLGTTTTTGRNSGVGTAVGQMIYNATTGNVQVYKAINGWVNITHVGDDPPEGHTATGGTITNFTDGGKRYRLHEFLTPGTFTVSTVGNISSTVDYLVVGGGAGGGNDSGSGTGGGGGAGGFRTSMPEGPGGPGASAEPGLTVSATSYTVTIGAGGGPNAAGTPTVFGSIEAQGGGKGGNQGGQAGGAGGSGGGGGGPGGALGAGNRVTGDPATPAPNQGHDGAPGSPPAGGGGGAGGLGGTVSLNGNGGIGKRSTISGPAYSIGFSAPPVDTPGNGYFAGGGSNSANAMGGGGANGGPTAGSGTANSGGGGGGGGGNTSGGSGGSGVVYVRYEVNQTQ